MIHLLPQVSSTFLESWMRSPLRWICSAIASNLRLSRVTRPSMVEAPSPGDIWHSCGPTKLMLSNTGRNSATQQGTALAVKMFLRTFSNARTETIYLQQVEYVSIPQALMVVQCVYHYLVAGLFVWCLVLQKLHNISEIWNVSILR